LYNINTRTGYTNKIKNTNPCLQRNPMAKAYDVVGYVYEGEVVCDICHRKLVNELQKAHEEKHGKEMSESELDEIIRPIFESEEFDYELCCSTCYEVVKEYEVPETIIEISVNIGGRQNSPRVLLRTIKIQVGDVRHEGEVLEKVQEYIEECEFPELEDAEI
jgi:hypothetical protein